MQQKPVFTQVIYLAKNLLCNDALKSSYNCLMNYIQSVITSTTMLLFFLFTVLYEKRGREKKGTTKGVILRFNQLTTKYRVQ